MNNIRKHLPVSFNQNYSRYDWFDNLWGHECIVTLQQCSINK